MPDPNDPETNPPAQPLTQAQRELAEVLGRRLAEIWDEEQKAKAIAEPRDLADAIQKVKTRFFTGLSKAQNPTPEVPCQTPTQPPSPSPRPRPCQQEE